MLARRVDFDLQSCLCSAHLSRVYRVSGDDRACPPLTSGHADQAFVPWSVAGVHPVGPEEPFQGGGTGSNPVGPAQFFGEPTFLSRVYPADGNAPPLNPQPDDPPIRWRGRRPEASSSRSHGRADAEQSSRPRQRPPSLTPLPSAGRGSGGPRAQVPAAALAGQPSHATK